MDGLQADLVSVVVRTVGGRPREMRRALGSIAANAYRPLEVVIVYQGNDVAELEAILSVTAGFPALPVRVLQNAAAGDRRAENLNIGWEAGAGRYLAFLDDDDSLEPDHFCLLVSALQQSGRAWACAQVTLRKEDDNLASVNESRPFRRHRFSVVELWRENFVPIHSMLVDRSRLNDSLKRRPFCEALDRSEDWDFLIRLGFHHEPAMIEDFTCTYHVSTGLRNTNVSLMDADNQQQQELNRQAWARCKALVEQRKAELLAPLWWAREHFAPAVAEPAAMGVSVGPAPTAEPAPVANLRRRIVRKLIRILEGFL